jgi:hypothetical protein
MSAKRAERKESPFFELARVLGVSITLLAAS